MHFVRAEHLFTSLIDELVIGRSYSIPNIYLVHVMKCKPPATNHCFLLIHHRNEYLIFQKIIKLEYDFPDKFFPKAKDLVKQLLVSLI